MIHTMSMYSSTKALKDAVMRDRSLSSTEKLVYMLSVDQDKIKEFDPHLYGAILGVVNPMKANREKYDPVEKGAVIAIRIYYAENGFTPMADLALAFGDKVTIEWDVPAEREVYESGINAYTLYYDERPKREFKDW